MASLFFKYSTMNAGKSTALLQASHNYIESGMHTMLITAAIDDRYEQGKISSRLGIAADAYVFNDQDNLLAMIQQAHAEQPIDCVLVDESQFLTKAQVKELAQVVDQIKIPVMCYGLRTDFQGELFIGSQYLLAWADKLEELKTICHCGKKATMVMRLDEHGQPIKDGEQVAIGGNDIYKPVCRKHFQQAMWDLKL